MNYEYKVDPIHGRHYHKPECKMAEGYTSIKRQIRNVGGHRIKAFGRYYIPCPLCLDQGRQTEMSKKKCPNPECKKGKVYGGQPGKARQKMDCPVCHGTSFAPNDKVMPEHEMFNLVAFHHNNSQIEKLAVNIEMFMSKIPGDDERDWTSTEMASSLYAAGYRIAPELTAISDREMKTTDHYYHIQNIQTHLNNHAWSRQQTNYDSKFIAWLHHELQAIANEAYSLDQIRKGFEQESV